MSEYTFADIPLTNINLSDLACIFPSLLLSRCAERIPNEYEDGSLPVANVQCMAQDESGLWFGYADKPLAIGAGGVWQTEGDYILLGRTVLRDDWDTLVVPIPG